MGEEKRSDSTEGEKLIPVNYQLLFLYRIEQKEMPFDHDFGYFSPFSLPSYKKREDEKENEIAKIVIKSLAILLDLVQDELFPMS